MVELTPVFQFLTIAAWAWGALTWLLLCAFVATGAEARGRSAAGWFFLAFFFSPFVAAFGLLMVAPAANRVPEPVATAGTSANTVDRPWTCELCGNVNRPRSSMCRSCGRPFAARAPGPQ